MQPRFLASLLAYCAVGCGTMANLDGREFALFSLSDQRKPRYFGGVQNDVRWLDFKKVPAADIPLRLLACGFFIADIPVSAIADTATLRNVARQRKEWGEPVSIPVHYQARESLADSLWLSRHSVDRVADEFDCPRVTATYQDGNAVTYFDSRFMTDWETNRRSPPWPSRLDDPVK